MASENTVNALGILDDLIRDPESRAQFYEDPYDTLQNAGADPGDVPPTVWGALTEMTLEELGAIAALGVALAEAGIFDGSLHWRHVV
jgi:hypothetical protein